MYFVPIFNIQNFKSNFLNTNWILIGWGTYLTMMQVATSFERRQSNAKNDNVVLYKVQMYNVY